MCGIFSSKRKNKLCETNWKINREQVYFLAQYSSKLKMYSNVECYVFLGSFITKLSLGEYNVGGNVRQKYNPQSAEN